MIPKWFMYLLITFLGCVLIYVTFMLIWISLNILKTIYL